MDADIVEYAVDGGTRAAGKRLSQLALPDGVVVAMIARGRTPIPPRGSTTIEPGDHVFVVLRPETRPLVDRVFSAGRQQHPELPSLVEFPLTGSTNAEDLQDFYGIHLPVGEGATLDEVIRARMGGDVAVGSSMEMQGFILHVREIADGQIVTIGLAIPSSPQDSA